MKLDDLTRFLHEQIPISRHLGVSVLSYDGRSLRLSAPLSSNVNHASTAFGGSLSAVAILAGWTLLHLKLRELKLDDAHLVIQRSEIDFREPVDTDLIAVATLPDEADWVRFLATLRRHRRARVRVRGDLDGGARAAGSFEGVYVASRDAATAPDR